MTQTDHMTFYILFGMDTVYRLEILLSEFYRLYVSRLTMAVCELIVLVCDSAVEHSVLRAKFHYASWFVAGSKLVGDQLRTS